jgi:hypothetical protein
MESTPRFPQSLEIAARFPHSQQADDEADGKVENQKHVSHFPTARFSPSLKTENPCSAFSLALAASQDPTNREK